jgi:hypothetical protein
MAARSGIGRFTLVDPEILSPENVGRHTLSRADLGKAKVEGVRAAIERVNVAARVNTVLGRFEDLDGAPDLIIAATDSFTADSLINDYALRNELPAVYGGCWGEASVGEILYVVPGRTPCYECFATFRRGQAGIPADARKYTDPEFDATRLPGQAGLWANILVITGIMFQVVLALLDPESDRNALIDHDHTLFLVNVSSYSARMQPLAVTFGRVGKGCAVCDPSKLEQLGLGMTAPAQSLSG